MCKVSKRRKQYLPLLNCKPTTLVDQTRIDVEQTSLAMSPGVVILFVCLRNVFYVSVRKDRLHATVYTFGGILFVL
jgi:hypothetical protein